MSKRARTDETTRSWPYTCDQVILLSTGKIVTQESFYQRVTWACELAGELADQCLRSAWTMNTLQEIQTPGQPAWAYRSLEKIIGRQSLPGKHLDSRHVWISEEIAGEILRSQAAEALIIQGLLDGKTPHQFEQYTWVRNLSRSLNQREEEYEQPVRDYLDYKPSPPSAPRNSLPLGPVDKQYAYWKLTDMAKPCLQVKLPLTDRPETRKDWAWHSITVVLPSNVKQVLETLPGAGLRKPTLSLHHSRSGQAQVRLRLIITHAVPKPGKKGKRTAISCDWGERRHLTLTDGWLDPDDGLHLSGRAYHYQARGLQALQAARRRRAMVLLKKRRHLDALLRGRSDQKTLRVKRDLLERERVSVWAAHERCAAAWAHAAARYVIEVAKSIGAGMIYLEDLRSLEPRHSSHDANQRVNHQLRSRVFKLIEHKAKLEGLQVKYVKAYNTSKQCPLCQGHVKHHLSSDNPGEGRSWSTCQDCHHSRDRDLLAAEHILVKGLRAQQSNTKHAHKPRHSQRPSLTPHKRTRKLPPDNTTRNNGTRAGHEHQGDTVHSHSRPRPRPNLTSWGQREHASSYHPHRDTHGQQSAYTGRTRLTPARPVKLTKTRKIRTQ